MRKYFVTSKQLKYLIKEGYNPLIRKNALVELTRRNNIRKSKDWKLVGKKLK